MRILIFILLKKFCENIWDVPGHRGRVSGISQTVLYVKNMLKSLLFFIFSGLMLPIPRFFSFPVFSYTLKYIFILCSVNGQAKGAEICVSFRIYFILLI